MAMRILALLAVAIGLFANAAPAAAQTLRERAAQAQERRADANLTQEQRAEQQRKRALAIQRAQQANQLKEQKGVGGKYKPLERPN
jgi:hypothetical protein